MRNLLPYSPSSEDILIEIIKVKQQPRKTVLNNALTQLKADFDNYLCNTNNLERMKTYQKDYTNNGLKDLKEALLHCYESATVPLDKLKAEIKQSQPEELSLCQYCGIGIPTTFDHYLPKSFFPEFSVLGINLFPCCSDCNNIKNDDWLDDKGIREFINFYYDMIESIEQYLFCNIIIDNGIPIAEFYLKKPNSINIAFYKTIVNHYKKLDLLRKYALQSSGEIKKAIKILKRKNQRNKRNEENDIQLDLEDISISEAEIYGVNFWKVSLYQAMGDNPQFIDLILKNAV